MVPYVFFFWTLLENDLNLFWFCFNIRDIPINVYCPITKTSYNGPSWWKSRIQERPIFSTNADRRPNIKKNWIIINPERLLVFKAIRVCQQMHQSTIWTLPTHGPCIGAICNNSLFLKALWVNQQMHQSTSRTTPTRGRSRCAIQNNSLFLTLYKLVDECTSPPETRGRSTTPEGGGRVSDKNNSSLFISNTISNLSWQLFQYRWANKNNRLYNQWNTILYQISTI